MSIYEIPGIVKQAWPLAATPNNIMKWIDREIGDLSYHMVCRCLMSLKEIQDLKEKARRKEREQEKRTTIIPKYLYHVMNRLKTRTAAKHCEEIDGNKHLCTDN